jgi:muconolactone delta-isomerase
MKFLMISKPREAIFTLPPALLRQLTEASLAAANKQKKEGKILEIYWIPGSTCGVAIGECKTGEEMVKNFGEMPINAFYSYEVYPLADFNESMKMLIERLKEAEKMMPAPPK